MFGAEYFFIATLVVTAIAAGIDWRTGFIPNWLTLGTLAAAPLAHGLVAYGYTGSPMRALEGVGWSLGGAVACSLVPLLLYRIEPPQPSRETAAAHGLDEDEPLRGMYEGDIKLLAAIGALGMMMIGVEIELYAFVAAAVYALGRIVFRGNLVSTVGNALALATNPILPASRRREVSAETFTLMRFGPATFVGACICVLLEWRGGP